MFLKKGVLSGVFILLCLIQVSFCIASSSVVELYDAYVYEETDLLLDGKTLPVSVVLTPVKARIVLDDEVFLLDYGSEKKTTFYTIQIGGYITNACDEDFNDYDEGRYCKVRSGTLDGNEAIAKLTVLKHVPKIEVTYDVAGKDFFVGTTQEVTVTIKNTGDVDLTNIKFYDKYPWDLFLLSSSAGSILDNTLTYKRSSLRVGETVSVTSKMNIRNPSDTIQAGTLSYFDGDSTKTISVNPIQIKTSNPLSFDVDYSLVTGSKAVSSPTIDTVYDFSLIVTNNVGKLTPLTDLQIHFPSDFVLSDFELPLVDNRSQLVGSITDTREVVGEVMLTSPEVTIGFTYVYEGDFYKDEYVVKPIIPVDAKEASLVKTEIEYSLTHEDKDGKTRIYVPGNNEGYFLLFKNTGGVALENVRGTVSSSLFNETQFYVKHVAAGKNAILADIFYTVPDVTEKRTYDISSTVQYDGEGKTFDQNKSHSVSVIPLIDAVSANYVVTEISTYERAVSGRITSILPYITYVDMQLLHSLGPKVISDNHQYSALLAKLEPLEEKQVFSYRFFIAAGSSEEISTSFWANDVLVEKSFTVTGPKQGTSSASGLDVSVSAPASMSVGETDKMVLTFHNPSSGDTYEHIFVNFIPSVEISVSSFGREKITALVAGEKYTKEIPFTALKPGNITLGTFIVSYFSTAGEPFVTEPKEVIITVESDGLLSQELLFIEGSLSLIGEAGQDETVQIILNNPSDQLVSGSFFINNNSISYSLDGGETKDYYFTISHLESDLLQKTGLVLEIEQDSNENTQQVLTVQDSVTVSSGDIVIVDQLDGSSESNIVLVANETPLIDSKNPLIVSLIVVSGLILFFIAIANIYKKKRGQRI